jgi:hypothetical protein
MLLVLIAAGQVSNQVIKTNSKLFSGLLNGGRIAKLSYSVKRVAGAKIRQAPL